MPEAVTLEVSLGLKDQTFAAEYGHKGSADRHGSLDYIVREAWVVHDLVRKSDKVSDVVDQGKIQDPRLFKFLDIPVRRPARDISTVESMAGKQEEFPFCIEPHLGYRNPRVAMGYGCRGCGGTR